MSKEEKQIQRIKAAPKDYTYSEARALVQRLGYEEKNKGRTSGSRVLFYRERDDRKILLHKPHEGNSMDVAAVKDLRDFLIQNGDIY